MKESTMITQSTVIAMGWTKTLIAKLLPEPKLIENPHYKKAAPMRLFNRQDVLDAMEKDEFKNAILKKEKRKSATAKATETKRKNVIDEMCELGKNISVKLISEETLIADVLEDNKNRIISRMEKQVDYYDRKGHWQEYDEAVNELECFQFQRPCDDVLNRWVVNYIRHNLLNYDETLLKLKGKTGKDDGYKELKKQILYKIADIYPKYADECMKQAAELDYIY